MTEQKKKETEQLNKTCSINEPFEEIFVCECHNTSKILHFFYFLPDKNNEDEDDAIWLNVLLSNWRSFFSRLYLAFLYMFGREPSGGLFNTPCLNRKDVPRLLNILDKQIKSKKAEPVELLELLSNQYLLRIEHKIYDGDWSELSFEVFLPPNLGFLRRSLRLFKYVMGFASCFGWHDEFPVKPQQSAQLKYLAIQHENAKRHGN